MEREARHLYAGYDNHVIIRDLPLRIPAGLDGGSVHEQDSRRLASSLAILPQNPSAPGG